MDLNLTYILSNKTEKCILSGQLKLNPPVTNYFHEILFILFVTIAGLFIQSKYSSGFSTFIIKQNC